MGVSLWPAEGLLFSGLTPGTPGVSFGPYSRSHPPLVQYGWCHSVSLTGVVIGVVDSSSSTVLGILTGSPSGAGVDSFGTLVAPFLLTGGPWFLLADGDPTTLWEGGLTIASPWIDSGS